MKNKKITVLYIEGNMDGTIGGPHYCLLDMVAELDKDKFYPIVLFYEDNVLINEFIQAGAEVIVYNKPRGKNLLKYIANKPIKFLKIIVRPLQVILNTINVNIIPLFYFIYLIYKYNISIIHNNNTVFTEMEWVFASKLTRKVVIGHQRGFYNEIPAYSGFHSKHYDYILGMSIATRDNLKELGISIDNYETFYDRIDIDKIQKKVTKSITDVKKEFNIKDGIPLVGIVGNFQKWKGQLTVVEAIHQLQNKYPDIKCLMIGDISKKQQQDIDFYNEIKSKINEYKLENNIIITGYRNDVPNLVNTLDICIHASIRPEPYGLVVLEAMALGKAEIASNEGGPVEMIENGISGFLIEPGNPDMLREKIDYLLSDPTFRFRLGENALERVKTKFSTLDIKYIENLYLKLLHK